MIFKTRKDFASLINDRGFKTGVEIGVAHGGFSHWLLSQTKLETLWCIDPHIQITGTLPIAEEALKPFIKSGRCRLVIEPSTEALKSLGCGCASIDFIYIDGDHGYEAVRDDISGWWPTLKHGGFMGGHDYILGHGMGVVRAVNEFIANQVLELCLTGAENPDDAGMEFNVPSWGVFKP